MQIVHGGKAAWYQKSNFNSMENFSGAYIKQNHMFQSCFKIGLQPIFDFLDIRSKL